RYVFVTSQGRSNRGGNAVNIYEVEYKNPPTERFCPACGAPRTEDLKQCPKCQLQYEGMTVMNDSTASSDNNDLAANTLLPTSNTLYYAGGALVAVLAGAFLFLRSRRKK
ncbi:MAG: LPXTG cell wall anchor domain-containing protein, partial [Prevotella sp.]|nr:LPXTG cell wall anchor domain-containing protein [Prevotella sp.]